MVPIFIYSYFLHAHLPSQAHSSLYPLNIREYINEFHLLFKYLLNSISFLPILTKNFPIFYFLTQLLTIFILPPLVFFPLGDFFFPFAIYPLQQLLPFIFFSKGDFIVLFNKSTLSFLVLQGNLYLNAQNYFFLILLFS